MFGRVRIELFWESLPSDCSLPSTPDIRRSRNYGITLKGALLLSTPLGVVTVT